MKLYLHKYGGSAKVGAGAYFLSLFFCLIGFNLFKAYFLRLHALTTRTLKNEGLPAVDRVARRGTERVVWESLRGSNNLPCLPSCLVEVVNTVIAEPTKL